jgi:hypothetical protein
MTRRRRWTRNLVIACWAMALMGPMPALPLADLSGYPNRVTQDRSRRRRENGSTVLARPPRRVQRPGHAGRVGIGSELPRSASVRHAVSNRLSSAPRGQGGY